MTEVISLNNQQAHLVLNIINLEKTIILIIPGGAYAFLSNRESGPVSVKFNTLNYNTAILYYSLPPHEKAVPYEDGICALEYLKQKYENIIIMGFSAGGHLAGLLGTKSNPKLYNVKAMILSYPVISFGEYTHEDTRKNFLNNEITNELINEYSVEKCVNENTVPTFIWTTKTDELVPYNNTLLLKEALDKYQIYNECIIYPKGPHGYALADITAVKKDGPNFYNKRISKWPLLADKFIKKILGNN